MTAPSQSQISVSRDVQFFGDDMVGRPFQDQFRQDTDAQPFFYHGHDRIIVYCGEADVGLHSAALKDLGDVRFAAFFQQHKGLLSQGCGGKSVTIRQWVIFGQDNEQAVSL